MKILCTLLIALLCALGLSACGNNGTDTPDTQQNQTEPDATAPDTNTNVPPEGNVNSQGPDGTAGDGTVTGDLKNAADDVGNALGYGRRNFYRLVRQNFCCTFSAYLREYRINRAAQEFRDSEEPISHIARAVGFNDYSYFSRCFRQYTGVAPAAYFRNWTK